MKLSNKVSIGALTISSALILAGPLTALAATNPSLGEAAPFSVLAQSGITGTGTISGNVENNGTGAAITALTTAMVAGTIYSSDAVATTGAPPAPTTLLDADVNANASTAYTTTIPAYPIEGTPIVGAELNGITRGPGVYDLVGATITLTGGSITLDGPGTYIFRTTGILTTSGAVNLINGARACDVFWNVGTGANINGTSFAGTILAGTAIAFGAGVTLNGRALAIGTAVTLNGATISGPTCATAGSGVVSRGPYIAPIFPLISLTKIPDPLALPSGPGPVTYTYTAINIGQVAMHNVWVTDNKCSPLTFISGDSNGDSKLDMDEAWVYRCTKTVSLTETNTATAHGSANNGEVWDTANATVVVGASIVPPLIHVVKVPSVFTLSAPGGAVTYTYTVTNPGTAPLSNVSITDDKCTGLPGRVVGHPGDVNKNNLLESNEVWTFTCRSNLTHTTTNTGTAEGSANGLTARDLAFATVVVASPRLPSTGLPSRNETMPWGIVLVSGILMTALTSFVLALRKR